MTSPEIYHLDRTKFVPNSRLPVLIYRNVLPIPYSEGSAIAYLERNAWECKGVWGMIKRHHFHSNTHECYGIFQGSSRLLLGASPLDEAQYGIEVDIYAGDVMITPAGVSHCSLFSQGDYKYCGVYPRGSPKWDSEDCEAPEKVELFAENTSRVKLPEMDPVVGEQGPLMEIWGSIYNNQNIKVL